MFQINEDVIHKSAGACVVSDIITKDFGNGDTMYYLLKPKFPSIVNKALEIFLPVDNNGELIRKPLTKKEVVALIKAIPSMNDEWITDAKSRKLKFEKIYHSGDIKELCQLVKFLYADSDTFAKPMSLTDKNFLLRIKNNLFDEFAVALDILPSDVEDYVKKFLV